MCDMQKMPTREDASCEEDTDMNFATFSAVGTAGTHFVTTGGQLPVAKLQQNVTNNGTGMQQVCVAMGDGGVQYMRALDGSVQAAPQLISVPIQLAGAKPGDPQPTVQIQVLSPSMLQAQQQPKYQMQIPIQGFQQGGAVLTVAYSPEANETGGIQLVGQGSLGEGLQVLAALPQEMQLVQQTQDKDHMQQNMHQVFITPNQQIIINAPENKTLNNNTTSDNNNSGPIEVIIKEECDENVNDDESSQGTEAGDSMYWQLNQSHQQDLVKYLSTLPPQQTQALPVSLQQFLRLNPTDVKKSEPVDIEIEMNDVTNDKIEEPVAEAVLSEGNRVDSNSKLQIPREQLQNEDSFLYRSNIGGCLQFDSAVPLGNSSQDVSWEEFPSETNTRTDSLYDTVRPPEEYSLITNPNYTGNYETVIVTNPNHNIFMRNGFERIVPVNDITNTSVQECVAEPRLDPFIDESMKQTGLLKQNEGDERRDQYVPNKNQNLEHSYENIIVTDPYHDTSMRMKDCDLTTNLGFKDLGKCVDSNTKVQIPREQLQNEDSLHRSNIGSCLQFDSAVPTPLTENQLYSMVYFNTHSIASSINADTGEKPVFDTLIRQKEYPNHLYDTNELQKSSVFAKNPTGDILPEVHTSRDISSVGFFSPPICKNQSKYIPNTSVHECIPEPCLDPLFDETLNQTGLFKHNEDSLLCRSNIGSCLQFDSAVPNPLNENDSMVDTHFIGSSNKAGTGTKSHTLIRQKEYPNHLYDTNELQNSSVSARNLTDDTSPEVCPSIFINQSNQIMQPLIDTMTNLEINTGQSKNVNIPTTYPVYETGTSWEEFPSETNTRTDLLYNAVRPPEEYSLITHPKHTGGDENVFVTNPEQRRFIRTNDCHLTTNVQFKGVVPVNDISNISEIDSSAKPAYDEDIVEQRENLPLNSQPIGYIHKKKKACLIISALEEHVCCVEVEHRTIDTQNETVPFSLERFGFPTPKFPKIIIKLGVLLKKHKKKHQKKKKRKFKKKMRMLFEKLHMLHTVLSALNKRNGKQKEKKCKSKNDQGLVNSSGIEQPFPEHPTTYVHRENTNPLEEHVPDTENDITRQITPTPKYFSEQSLQPKFVKITNQFVSQSDESQHELFTSLGLIPTKAVSQNELFTSQVLIPTKAVSQNELFTSLGLIPTEAVSENPPTKAVSQNELFTSLGLIPTEAVSQNAPTKTVLQNALTKAVSQNALTKAVSQNAPTKAVSQNAPTKAVSHSALTKAVSQNAPTKAVSQNAPTKPVSQNAPTKAVSHSALTKAVSQNAPTKAVSQNAPTKPVSQNAPTKAVSQNALTKAVSQNAPTKAVSQNAPTKAVSQNALTKAMSQNKLFGSLGLIPTNREIGQSIQYATNEHPQMTHNHESSHKTNTPVLESKFSSNIKVKLGVCRCANKCQLKIGAKQQHKICEKFYELCGFKKQSLYLQALLSVRFKVSQGVLDEKVSNFCNYYIRNLKGEKIKVCKTFFQNTFLLSENRLNRIKQSININKIWKCPNRVPTRELSKRDSSRYLSRPGKKTQRIENTRNQFRVLDGTLRIQSKKKKKYKKKPSKPARPKPGQVVIATAVDGSAIFCCPECQMAYSEKEQLEIHLIVHKIERRFICGICGAGLKRKEHLERHKMGHNPERPYVCGVCRKGFKRREHLNLHTVIHSGVKTEMCTECGKGFYRKDHLRKHTRSHETKRARDEAAGDSSPAPVQPASGNNNIMPEITIHIPTSSNSQMPVQINIPQHVVSSLAASQQHASEQSTLDALLAHHS